MPSKAEAKKVGSAATKKVAAAKAEKEEKKSTKKTEVKVEKKETETSKKTTTKVDASSVKEVKSAAKSKDAKKPNESFEKKNVERKPGDQPSYKEKAQEIENNIKAKIDANPAIVNGKYRKVVTVNKLMETGTHIGLPSKRWNPKMKPYIYAKKGNNYIIDLVQTVIGLNAAYNFLYNLAKDSQAASANNPLAKEKTGPVLIVGTRGWVIKNHVKEQSKRTGSYYINERWLGGTLTNFKTISNSIKRFNNLVLMHKNGDIEKYNKKEKGMIKKETEKKAKFFSGIWTMKELPKAIILTDPENEKIALTEAKKLGIPVVALCNTNANVDNIDYVIPANNYSIKSVYLLVGILCDAIAEGRELPTQFVGKPDSEIVLPEVVKKKQDPRKAAYHSR